MGSGMQRVAAQRRKIGDKDDGADGAGEILGNDGEGQPGGVVTEYRLPGKRQIGEGLRQAADPQTRR